MTSFSTLRPLPLPTRLRRRAEHQARKGGASPGASLSQPAAGHNFRPVRSISEGVTPPHPLSARNMTCYPESARAPGVGMRPTRISVIAPNVFPATEATKIPERQTAPEKPWA